MSLSRLEKEAVQAEEARVQTLREKARTETVDERKLRKKVVDEEREHTRYCVKGARRCLKKRKSSAKPYPLCAAAAAAELATHAGCLSARGQHLVLQGPRRPAARAAAADGPARVLGARRRGRSHACLGAGTGGLVPHPQRGGPHHQHPVAGRCARGSLAAVRARARCD